MTHEYHDQNGNISDSKYDASGTEISRTWSTASGDSGEKLLLSNQVIADSVNKVDGTKIVTITDSTGLKSASYVGSYGDDNLSFDFVKSFIAPSSGNDMISISQGDNVYAYNIGDGRDTIVSTGTGHNTLSLGGGISLDMISLKKVGNDLIVSLWGDSQSVNFQGWYGNPSSHHFDTLQVILADPDSGASITGEKYRYQSFDLEKLASEYDSANVSPAGNYWSATQALRSAYIAGSDDQAIGGALAQQYGNLYDVNVDLIGVSSILSDSRFGTPA